MSKSNNSQSIVLLLSESEQVSAAPTATITGNVLQSSTLNIPTTGVTLNLSHHAALNLSLPLLSQAVVNVDGNATVNADVAGIGFSYALRAVLTENLAAHTNLHGIFNVGTYASLTMNGAAHSTYHNDGTDTLAGGNVVIDTDVVGSGTFLLTQGFTRQGAAGSHLEFGGYVGSGETIQVTGGQSTYPGTAGISALKIDEPTQFHGTVDLHDFSMTDLVGLVQADHWSYADDMLSISDGAGRVIDTLHVITDNARATEGTGGLFVARGTAGDVIVRPGMDFAGVIAVPTT